MALPLSSFRKLRSFYQIGHRPDEVGVGVSAHSSETLLLHLDVMDERSIAAARAKVTRAFGRADFLVNTAGRGALRLFRRQTDRDIDRQVRTNLPGLCPGSGPGPSLTPFGSQ